MKDIHLNDIDVVNLCLIQTTRCQGDEESVVELVRRTREKAEFVLPYGDPGLDTQNTHGSHLFLLPPPRPTPLPSVHSQPDISHKATT